jgi:endonuclease III
MKDSKEYSDEFQKFYRKLKRAYGKVKKPYYEDPVGALVYGIISERTSESWARGAYKRILEHFVDFNDLRVSPSGEILEVLGEDTVVTCGIASALVGALRALFAKNNMVSLLGLCQMSKRPARQVLSKIGGGVSRFVVNYCMLMSLQSHAIPLTEKMVEYLRSNGLVHPESDEQEIEGFLMRQISSSEAYKFYTYLRSESEGVGSKVKKREKKTTKTRTKKSTSKKKTRKRR